MGIIPMATATGQVCASAVILLPLMLMVDRPWTLPPPHAETWAAVIGVGLVCTAFTHMLYFRILAAAGAANLLLVTFLIPVTAILLCAIVLGETLHPGTPAPWRHGTDRRGPRLHRRPPAPVADGTPHGRFRPAELSTRRDTVSSPAIP